MNQKYPSSETSTVNIQTRGQSEKWSTEFDGEITDISINGRRIMEIHDLALKCEKYAKFYTYSCIIGVLAFIGLIVTLAQWIPDHSKINNIQKTLEDTNARVNYMISVRPGNRETNPYNGWQYSGDTIVVPAVLQD